MEGLCLIWRKITLKGGLLEKLDPGDSVMAERDFTIGDFLEGKGPSLNIPSFLSKKDQQLLNSSKQDALPSFGLWQVPNGDDQTLQNFGIFPNHST